MKKNLYSLGLEFSTQSAKMIVLDLNEKSVVYTGKFEFDENFPKYGTKGGVLSSDRLGLRHTSPYLMLEALDFVFDKLKKDGVDLAAVGVIKLDGMQHCTVYTDTTFSNRLKSLSNAKNLLEALKDSISRKTSPIWEDRSTEKEAGAITKALETSGSISNITGNKAELRFPASQILRWAKESPLEYKNTENIQLLSAFLTSILTGKIAPVDTGDGWGSNLNNLDIKKPGWSKEVIKVMDMLLAKEGIKDSVGGKIGGISHYDEPVGKINPYFINKYGVGRDAVILAGTGDNPATLLGCGGHIVISLGSSYTVNGLMKLIKPSINGEYNIFGYTKGTAMALTCYTNGSKLHDTFVRRYILKSENGSLTKEAFDSYMKKFGDQKISGNEKLMLPYLLDESVPVKKAGIIRDGFTEDDAEANIRSLHISQVLSLKLHSSHLSDVKSICVVGGGSKNHILRQTIADIFKAEIFSIKNSDFAAPLGCAISGAKTLLKISYEKAAEFFVQRAEGTSSAPIAENTPIYEKLLKKYEDLEKRSI